MKNWRKAFIVAVVIGMFIPSLFGQQYQYANYRTEDGLVQSEVTCLTQDKKGNLWVGTTGGLSIYNGRTFINFASQNGLSEDWVTSIYPSKFGHVLVGHYGGNMSFYNCLSKKLRALKTDSIIGFHGVTNICEVDSNNFYILSANSELFRLSIRDSLLFKKVVLETNYAHIKKIISLPKNRLIILHENGMDLLENGKTSQLSTKPFLDATVFRDEQLVAITQHSIDFLDTENFQPVKNVFNPTILKDYNLEQLSVDLGGNPWIIGAEQTIIGLFPEKTIILGKETGLHLPEISCTYVDRENQLWIGSSIGVERFLGESFITYTDKYIAHNLVWDVTNLGDNKYAIGTHSGLSYITIDEHNQVIQDQSFFLHQKVNSVYTYGSQLLVGLESGDLYLAEYGQAGKLICNLASPIISISRKVDDLVWVATEEGLYEVSLISGNYHRIVVEEKGQELVIFLQKDQFGNTWLSNWSRGLYKWDGKRFEKEKLEISEIDNGFVFSLYVQSQTKFWCGVYGVGLIYVDLESKKHRIYNWKDGLKNSTPTALASTGDSLLWIGGDNCLELLKLNTQSFFSYDKNKGFGGIEVNSNTFLLDESDGLLMGTLIGLVKFQFETEATSAFIPQLQFEWLTINKQVAPFPPDSIFMAIENDLEFGFEAYSPAFGNEILFSYRLIPTDSNWSTPTTNRSAMLNNLKPGNYNLEVKCAYKNSSSKIVSYPFIIMVPFYEQTWFYATQIGVLIILFIMAYFHGRKTKGSRLATIFATIGVIILFEWGLSLVEANIDDYARGIGFLKITLNVLLALLLFPIEHYIKKIILNSHE